MTDYKASSNLEAQIEMNIKRIKLSGYAAEFICLIVACVFLFMQHIIISSILAFISLFSLVVFSTIIPNNMLKQRKKLLELDPLLKVDNTGVSHSGALLPWDNMTRIVRLRDKESHKAITIGDNLYLFTNMTELPSCSKVSPWLLKISGRITLRINLEHLEEPEKFLNDLSNKSFKGDIKVLETSNLAEAGKFLN